MLEAVNYNSPGKIVIAGNRAAVERGMELAKAKGEKRALMLWEVCFSPSRTAKNITRKQAVHWGVFLLLALLLLFNDRYWQLMAFSAGLLWTPPLRQ